MKKHDLELLYKIRLENIKYIFTRTIYQMDEVVFMYDYCFTRLCYHSHGKHDLKILHERALKLTIKLLS
jgi:metal-dependent HD superfamily phosphatase/phosphodiesterase